MKPLLLIDGDQFIYKATAACEQETRWDEINHTLYSNPDTAYGLLEDMLKRVFERFDSDQHALCFTASDNFRRDIDPDYKLARRGQRKPLCYGEVLRRCHQHHDCITMAGLEADDVMGILATKPGPTERIIVSQDKDMKTIPATVWNGQDLTTYTEAEADYWHLYQTLVGDPSDGYKGCPGTGPKKAEKVLAGASAWEAVVEAFKKANLTEDEALKQARLARILRWKDWDSEKKRPILWTPKSM